jgi:predicted GNAT family acetyltransferase
MDSLTHVLRRAGLTVLVLYLVFLVVFKIKYPFWAKQPVFHFHNLYYWVKPPGIINHGSPKRTKFFEDTIYFDKMTNVGKTKKKDFVRLVQRHYMHRKSTDYAPSAKSILSYLDNTKSYMGMKYKNNELVGSITGRPLLCSIDGNNIVVNYVDFLCVKKQHRKQGIAPRLIYTYMVRQREAITANPVFIFKRETAITFIVPLCCYMTYGFSLKYVREPVPIVGAVQFIRLTGKQLDLLYRYQVPLQKEFRCVIFTPYGHLAHLVDSGSIMIYAIIDGTNAYAFYFFRRTDTTIDGDRVIECLGSFCNCKNNIDLFIQGFLNAVDANRKLIKAGTIIIENLSHNCLLLKSYMLTNTVQFKSPTSYYFYNFAYHPFESKDVLVVC